MTHAISIGAFETVKRGLSREALLRFGLLFFRAVLVLWLVVWAFATVQGAIAGYQPSREAGFTLIALSGGVFATVMRPLLGGVALASLGFVGMALLEPIAQPGLGLGAIMLGLAAPIAGGNDRLGS